MGATLQIGAGLLLLSRCQTDRWFRLLASIIRQLNRELTRKPLLVLAILSFAGSSSVRQLKQCHKVICKIFRDFACFYRLIVV